MTTVYSEPEVLALMLADDTPDPRPGRPPIVLYPSVAAQALQELSTAAATGPWRAAAGGQNRG